jgi:hypothetical protein
MRVPPVTAPVWVERGAPARKGFVKGEISPLVNHKYTIAG